MKGITEKLTRFRPVRRNRLWQATILNKNLPRCPSHDPLAAQNGFGDSMGSTVICNVNPALTAVPGPEHVCKSHRGPLKLPFHQVQLVSRLGDYTRDEENFWPHFHPAKSLSCADSTTQTGRHSPLTKG